MGVKFFCCGWCTFSSDLGLWSLRMFVKLSYCLLISVFLSNISKASFMASLSLSLLFEIILVLLVNCSRVGLLLCASLK